MLSSHTHSPLSPEVEPAFKAVNDAINLSRKSVFIEVYYEIGEVG
jgi:hypothetical protein